MPRPWQRPRPVLAATLTLLLAGGVVAGPENVDFPENYASTFVRYTTVDKPDRDPPIVRFMYINTDALAEARPDEPLPHGSVVVMEDHAARLTDDGEPVLDADGRFLPTDEITNVFVQEKQPGWGEEYAEEKRNGEWEYAWFQPDGSRRDEDMDACFACHRQVADQDFTFTTWPFIRHIKEVVEER
ncbi:cytochrome P460 family protein [Halomonas ramblicola]|uniref:cytochrome P460 family protein n=1 Tax=Halomonas ramblicola TaxID=747349 RepID=UPI0025B4585E|nr:cytochrome P460 family protein [Halomonas ramblicola]MDN3523576.1 cytochrome P460 family protein [Halomonas ramblicola]